MDKIQYAASLTVKPILCAIISNALQRFSGDVLYINICLRTNLTGNDNGSGCCKCLARTAHMIDIGSLPRRRNIALCLQL